MKLRGSVISHNDNVILTGDTIRDQTAWRTTATRQSFDVRTVPTVPTPAQIDMGQGVPLERAQLTPTSATEPNGSLVVTLAATTPAAGLNAPVTRLYVETFDPSTGRRTSTATVKSQFDPDRFSLLAATTDSTIGYFDDPNTSAKATLVSIASNSGQIRWQHEIGSECCDVTRDRVFAPSIWTGDSCGPLNVFDIATGRVVASLDVASIKAVMPYLNCWNEGSSSHVTDESFVYRGPTYSNQAVVSASTGKVLRDLKQDYYLFDSRSSLAVQAPAEGSSSPVTAYDTPSWRTVWSLPNDRALALRLTISSLYDRDLYVTTSTQHLIIAATNGKTIANSWNNYPVLGSSDWLVAASATTDSNANPSYALARHVTSAASAIAAHHG